MTKFLLITILLPYLFMDVNVSETPTACAPCVCKLDQGMHLAICNNTAMHLHESINFTTVINKITKDVQGIQMIQFPLSEITRTIFNELDFDNLTDFQITQCSLYKINDNAFNHYSLKNIETLLLSENEISELEIDAFNGLKRLKYLKLDHNKLTELNSMKLFGGCPQLEEICLSSNELSYLSPDLFVGNKALKQLDISENKLLSIEYGLIGHLNLTFLFVHDNLWNCHTMERTIAILIKEHLYDSKGVCTYPKEYNNNNWTYYINQVSVFSNNTIPHESRTESTNVGAKIGYSILAIMLIICGIGLYFFIKCRKNNPKEDNSAENETSETEETSLK